MVGFHERWSKDEDKLLTENYQRPKRDILTLFPNRSAAAVNQRACKLGLRKERNEYVLGKCDILLEESLSAYYWVGFILADGYISDKFRLRVTLANKDRNHLEKLGIFLNLPLFDTSNNSCSLQCQDRWVFSKLKEKFDILKTKTYNPPSCLVGSDEQILATFIGIIDGDGSIKKQTSRNDCSLQIHCHQSWLQYYTLIYNKIQNIFSIKCSAPYIAKDGYLIWSLSNHKILFGLKNFIIKNNLQVLSRKWDIIDLTQNFRSDKISLKELILPLIKQNLSPKEIQKMYKVSDSYISVLKSKEAV